MTRDIDVLIAKEADDLAFVLPQPSAEGIAEFKQFFYAKRGRWLTNEDAAEVLSHLISIVFHSAVIDLTCSDTGSTLGSPTTTRR